MRTSIVILSLAGLLTFAGCAAEPMEDVGVDESDIKANTPSAASGVVSTQRRVCKDRNDIVSRVPATLEAEYGPKVIVISGYQGSAFHFDIASLTTFFGDAANARKLGAAIPDKSPVHAWNSTSGTETLTFQAQRENGATLLKAYDMLCDRHWKGTTTNSDEAILKNARERAERHLWANGSCDALKRRCEAARGEKGGAGRGATPATCSVEICAPASETVKKQAAEFSYNYQRKTSYTPTYVLAQIKADCVLCTKNPNPPPPHVE